MLNRIQKSKGQHSQATILQEYEDLYKECQDVIYSLAPYQDSCRFTVPVLNSARFKLEECIDIICSRLRQEGLKVTRMQNTIDINWAPVDTEKQVKKWGNDGKNVNWSSITDEYGNVEKIPFYVVGHTYVNPPTKSQNHPFDHVPKEEPVKPKKTKKTKRQFIFQ